MNDEFGDKLELMKWLSRVDTGKTHGYQFRVERSDLTERKFFSDVKYGSPEAALKAAQDHRNQFVAAAQELELLSLDNPNSRRGYLTTLMANNTSGIIGVNRRTPINEAGNPESSWQTNFKKPDGSTGHRSRAVKRHGEGAALTQVIGLRQQAIADLLAVSDNEYVRDTLRALVQYYQDLLDYIAAIEDTGELLQFLATINDERIANTDKEDFINRRIGQQRFRRLILARWNDRCCVTGASQLLIAAHIKPWHAADDTERLDIHNGLALSPVYDKAFDVGYITFNDDGRIVISAKFRHNAATLGVAGEDEISGLTKENCEYLAWHRANVFHSFTDRPANNCVNRSGGSCGN